MAFPFMIPLLMRLGNPIRQFMGIVILSIGYPMCVMAFDWTLAWHFGWVALFRVLNGFMLGCLLYYFQEHCLFVKTSSRAGRWCASFLICLVYFIIVGAPILFIYALIPWSIVTLAHVKQGIGTVFSNKAAVLLGTISFSIYMVHFPVLEVFRFGLNEYYASLIPAMHQTILWIHLCFMLFSVIAVSCLWYWGVEKPCREYVKQRWNQGDRVTSEFLEGRTSRVMTCGRNV